MIRIEYEKFVNYTLGLYTSGKRRLRGKFREDGSRNIHTEELDCLNYKDDAKKSYEATIKYFNHTRTEKEPFRKIVSAEWLSKKLKYNTENERLDLGLCPKCETALVKASHHGGQLDDKHAVCPKCKWEDWE